MFQRRQLLILLALLPFWLAAQVGDLPRSTPAAEGISTQAVINMIDSLMALPKCDIHHVMVVRHGKVVAEVHPMPYRDVHSHTLYSASKTFTSLAVGIAIDENRLCLNDRVMTFFPDKWPDSISDNLATITVRDLLMMASGIKPDWAMRDMGEDWVTAWLAKSCDEAPGSHFQYDSMCTFMLSAIVQRVTGRTMLEYLQEKLFAPMHITVADSEMSPDGICTGGWGLRVQAETMAKLGLLLLHNGNWKGQQLVSADYIRQACSPLIYYKGRKETDAPTDGNQGYGFQIWRCKWPGAVRADGAFGQYSVVVPQEDLVVVILGMIPNGHPELACIWNQLMPGMKNASLKPEKKLQKKLEKLCINASLPLPEGKKTGKAINHSRLVMQDNSYGLDWIEITPEGEFTFAKKGEPQETLRMGFRQWEYDRLIGYPPYSINALNRMRDLEHDFVAATAYAWTSKNVLEVRIHYVNWLSATTFTIDFGKNQVTVCDNFPSSKPCTMSFTLK